MTQIHALYVALATGTPVFLWGPAGVGKSATITTIAQHLQWPLETIIAAIYESIDISGLPLLAGDAVAFAPPGWVRRLAEVERGILFLDELPQAKESVIAGLLRVVRERMAGEHALAPGVSIVAAGNPPKATYGGMDLLAQMANRFCHLPWTCSYPAWAEGMLLGWPMPTLPPLTPWAHEVLPARALIIGFLDKHRALLLQEPQDEVAAGQAWPSPRSWDLAANLLAGCRAWQLMDVAPELVTGCVGEGPALEFLQWLKTLDLPDPEAVLSVAAKFPWPKRTDVAAVILNSAIAAVLAELTPERWLQGWELLGNAARSQLKDLGALAARTLAKHRPDSRTRPPLAHLEPYAKILDAAGITMWKE